MPLLETDMKLDFKDVLIRPKRSSLKSRSEVNLHRTFTFKYSERQFTGIPIIASDMDTTGTFEMASALAKHGMFTLLHKYNTVEQWKKFANSNPKALKHVAVSTGISEHGAQVLRDIIREIPTLDCICIGTANGYSKYLVDFLKSTRKEFPTHIIVAGDVATPEMVHELILAGADIVKVGLGSGSVCTTRIMTGVGYPQLSVILECAAAAHGLGGHIISDGGCTCPGDIAKAFGAGADFVMLGGMLAGHIQCQGDVIESNGKKTSVFYGMSSASHMEFHFGGISEHRAAEGRTVEVPYRGDVGETIQAICGGIRSTCTYIGAANLEELPERTTFIRVTQQANEIFRGNDVSRNISRNSKAAIDR